MATYLHSFRWGMTLAFALCAALAVPLVAAEPEVIPAVPAAQDGREPHLLGSLSCASAACHGGESSRSPRREYGLWLAHDPHARSAETLASSEFRRILALVSSGRENGKADPAVYSRCAACHDPQGLAMEEGNLEQLLSSRGDFATRGIGCESCHGPADTWIARHYERDQTRESLAALGMVDTKNLRVRAETCAACHVGDAGHDLNHDMLAVGHPPLRFELSAYHDLIRHQHWSGAERIETPDFKVRLWAAGQHAAKESTRELLHSRATRANAGDKLTPWPELAEYDCFACHQRLRASTPPSVRNIAGQPAWQPWNLALVETEDSEGRWNDLRSALSLSLMTDPRQIQKLAAFTTPEPAEPVTLQQVLDLARRQATAANPTWAGSCQQFLALKAAYLAWRDAHPGQTAAWTRAYEERLTEVGQALSFGSRAFDWPAYDWKGLPPPQPSVKWTDLAAIAREIESLAAELAAEYKEDSSPRP